MFGEDGGLSMSSDFDFDDSGDMSTANDEDTSEDNCISVAHSDIVRLIRGGHNMGRHRRHKSKDQVKNGGRKNRDKTPPTHAYVNRSTTGPGKQKAAGKKLQLKFYRSCPSLRSSDMKFRLNSNCAPSKGHQTAIWEQIPNELEYCSSVPCSVSFRAAQKESQPKTSKRRTPKKGTAKEKRHDLRTIDNIGTRAACPIHLVSMPHEDYSHVESKMYLMQNKVAPGEGGYRKYKNMGKVQRHRQLRRPLDHFFDQVVEAASMKEKSEAKSKKHRSSSNKSKLRAPRI